MNRSLGFAIVMATTAKQHDYHITAPDFRTVAFDTSTAWPVTVS
jgi:hypothetical protein